MKNFVTKIVSLVICVFAFSCCSDEPEVYNVRVEAEASTNSAAYIFGVKDGNDIDAQFHNNFEGSFTTNTNDWPICLYCSDPDALLRIKIWVNDELTYEVIGFHKITLIKLIPFK